MNHSAEKPVLLAMGAALTALLIAAVLTVGNPGLVRQTSGAHSGQREQAIATITRLMERLQENPEDREALRRLANAFTAMQAWERASSFWQRLVSLDQDDLKARQNLAMTYFRMGEHRAAAEELEIVLQRDAGGVYAHFNLGILYGYYLESPDKAVEHLRAVARNTQAPDDLRKEARKHLQELQQ
jgi:tetratricopeptide (TPR) repeat protein